MSPSQAVDAVLGTVRTLLEELGSPDAATRVSLGSSLDRDLGLGSLERVEILVRLESVLGIRLPDEAAHTSHNPGDWVNAILECRSGPKKAPRWPIRQPTRESIPGPVGATSFAEVLQTRTEQDPDRVHIHLLDQDTGQDIRHADLLERSSQVASGLVASGLKPGDTVAIMLPTCIDFFSSFLGVMLAGGTAVPVYPPARPSQLEEYVRRQVLILRNAEVRFLISFDRVRAVANVLQGGLPSLREILSANELAARGNPGQLASVSPAEPFFIQYTSGSTGDPKGVMLTHSNVLANIRGIGFAVEVRPADAVVSWLPLYHDMGLIGSWLFSLYHGLPITILSPLDFLLRPERWLWALSDSRGTLCPAPNFAFELCVRKIRSESLNGVDLSPWRVAINAGEPVLATTLKRFAERFGPWGFDPRSYMPFYGLAESSVALTYPPFWRGPVVDQVDRDAFESEGRAVPSQNPGARDSLRFVANGLPLPDHEIRVVGEDGVDLPDRSRGRILFRGPSRTDGYFRNPGATADVLDADGWLDSGDLGYLVDGELYVTGRVKDCIIKGGHNIIPQDVEMAAWEVEGVRKGCVAAFGSPDPVSGTERLVVVVETRVTNPAHRKQMRSLVVETVAANIGTPPDEVVTVHPGFVPKTSSGKIQRSETRRLYETGATASQRGSSAWVQIARVGAHGAFRASLQRLQILAASSTESAAVILGGSIAVGLGLVARLAPTPGLARLFVCAGARAVAWLAGSRDSGQLGGEGVRVVLASRASVLDPVLVAGACRFPFVFADRTGFEGLGTAQAFLLEPLVAANGRSNGMDGLRPGLPGLAALRDGVSVVCLADNTPGEPAERTRFRAEGFEIADATGASVVPVLIYPRNGNGAYRVRSLNADGLSVAGGLAGMRKAVRKALHHAKPARTD